MTCIPPGGWIETLDPRGAQDTSNLGVFHTRETCDRIKHPDRLRRVDKPYSSVRCSACANPLAAPSGMGDDLVVLRERYLAAMNASDDAMDHWRNVRPSGIHSDDAPSGPAVREQTQALQRAGETWKACLVAWDAYRHARDGYE
jgi:hypothetical protein